ncbi:MAG TPA: hypothetical protein VN278_01490, partial [Methanosarcina sp.]|nr:hypothetical protein [Methanosarcina sp.]
AQIVELYSDIESFDVALYPNQQEGNLRLEVLLVKPDINEKILARQVFSIDNFPGNTRITKVGFWNIFNPDRGAYVVKARLLDGEKVLSEAEYSFVYGSNSPSRLQINDLAPNSQGISVALAAREASLFDIEYMLVDGSKVTYATKTEKLSLTSIPEVFSASWGTLLENNKEYTGRVKIQVYSPQREFITSIENFTARENAQITDIYQDETGASATVFGRSQVPFEGNLTFSVYKLGDASANGNFSLVESIREKVPVLLNNDDETVEVAWKQRLSKGVYRLEIELLGNDGDIIERRETIIESDLSQTSNASSANGSNNTNTTGTPENRGIPGFSLAALLTCLAVSSIFLKKSLK